MHLLHYPWSKIDRIRYNLLSIVGAVPKLLWRDALKPRPDLAVEESDGELIVLDKDGGEVHQLNQSAALIWQGLSEGLGTDEIAVLLTNAFDVDQKSAISDIETTITQLCELKLLTD